jgi:outer membrane protein
MENDMSCERDRFVSALIAVALIAPLAAQQATAPPGMSLPAALEAALRNYPSIRVSQAQIDAAAAGIQLARTAYLPHLDAAAQVNRATRNNVFGVMLPQGVFPSLSGPVLGTNNLGTAWNSAAGGLLTWEPFDFGQRAAGLAAAAASQSRAQAALKRTEFEVAATAADAFVTLAAAQELVKAAQAAVNRSEVIARNTQALAEAGLRPGADAARADAETAAARTLAIQAQQAVDTARANLARFTGGEPRDLTISPERLLDVPARRPVAPFQGNLVPAAAEQNAAIEQVRAQIRVLERSYFPKFALQAAAYARGAGAETNGRNLGGLNGLAPNTQNYAAGLTVTFPVFERSAIRAREAEQAANLRAETARYELLAVDLKARWNAAVAELDGAWRIAGNTPAQATAARAASEQAQARYQSGLGAMDAVAEAQRLVAQAEIDDALARLSVWRRLLGVAIAAGDLQPFLAEAGRP